MLTLRHEQMKALRRQRQEQFLERLAAHARRFFPRQTEGLRAHDLRQVCRSALQRGSRHGLSTERDLCKFLNLVFVFGPEFDEDPALPWVRPFLDDPTTGPTLKINRLYLEALRHENEGLGFAAGREGGP